MVDDTNDIPLDRWYEVDDVGLGLDEVMAQRTIQWSLARLDLPWEADDRPEWELALDEIDRSDDESDVAGDAPPEVSPCDACDARSEAFSDPWSRTCCCRRCHSAPRLHGYWPLCAECQVKILCRVCGIRPKLVKGRCDACRKYLSRHGIERPRSLITRSGERPLTLAELDLAIRRNHLADSDPFR